MNDPTRTTLDQRRRMDWHRQRRARDELREKLRECVELAARLPVDERDIEQKLRAVQDRLS